MAEGADAAGRGRRRRRRQAAEADRAALLDEKGDDANDSEAKVELIRRHLEER